MTDSVAMDGMRSSAGVVGPRLAEVGLNTADACKAGSLLLLEYGVEPPPELLGEFAAVIGTGWRVGSDTAAAEQIWDMFEREYLLAQVTRFGGNISRTATFVGMERSALHRKLKSLGLHGSGPEAAAEE